MDKAKAAISDFMGRSGHHDTSVHETVAPAVQHETIKPHQHEEINTAVDKEVHQDHYHRTVQPVHDREVLPETHEHKMGAVQHREVDHRDHEHTKRNLVQDQAQFKDERVVEGATSSRSAAPTVGGEHVHHHIHETIQPVVHKETIQPNVVHTTVPIHEVHHNKATHHDTTSLPAMSIDQFKAQGGSLTGREERYDEFKGVPKNIGGGTAGGLGTVRGMEHTSGQHSGLTHNATTAGTQGVTGSSTTGGLSGHHDNQHQHQHHAGGGLTGSSTTGGLAGASTGSGLTGHHDDQHHSDRGLTGSSTTGGLGAASTGSGLTGHHDNQHHSDRGLTGSSTTGSGLTGQHDHQHHSDRGLTGHHDKSHTDRGLTGHSGTTGTSGTVGSSTTGGLTERDQHHHADRGTGGQGNLTGSSTQGGVVSSGQRDDVVTTSDRNAGTGRAADGVVEGVHGTGKNDLSHRPEEDGSLPKALTEDRSKAVPHSKLTDDQHSTGHHTHGNTSGDHSSGTQKKGGLMDKLNPTTDSNGDGQKGFMK